MALVTTLFLWALGLAALAALLLVAGIALSVYRARRPDLPSEVPKGSAAVQSSPSRSSPRRGKETEVYDVIVVGAGPSGSTFAWDLKKSKPELKVLVLERAVFPRKKYCGDAWCEKALKILDEMEILDKLVDPAKYAKSLPPGVDLKNYESAGYPGGSPLARRVKSGGFISPGGVRCINDGDAASTYGSATPIRTYAIKRFIIDEWIARTAAAAGAELIEGCEVGEAKLDSESGVWTVTEKKLVPATSSGKHDVELETGDAGTAKSTATSRSFKGKLLVIADGSNSYLAQKLGLVHTQADSVCSHQYISPPTKPSTAPSLNVSADGIMLFTPSLLPGYSALFRHANEDIYLGTYVLPGGKAKARWIKPFEDTMIKENPYARELLKDGKWRESKKLAPIRCWTGDRTERSYGDRVLVIGDAAAQVDPLTGEGIHTAMVAARIAAGVAREMFANNSFSSSATAVYERRWHEEMGPEFLYSRMMAWILVQAPWILDSMAVVGSRRGQSFLDEFGEAMTGVKSKISLLRPGNAIEMVPEILKRLLFGPQAVPKGIPVVEGYQDSGAGIEEMFGRKGR